MSEQPNDNYDAKGSAAEVQDNLTAHIDDNIRHITSEERAFWNNSSNSYGSFPDFSRAVSIGAQETWMSTGTECYNAATAKVNNVAVDADGTFNAGCPYVLLLKYPCYLYLHPKMSQGDIVNDDDDEWCMFYGKPAFLNHVIGLNKRDDWRIANALLRMTEANGFSPFILGQDLFIYTETSDNDTKGGEHLFMVSKPIMLSQVGWYYRPCIGSGGSDTENWELWDFKLIPMINTPEGTLLAERIQFTAANKDSILNIAPRVYGVTDSNGNNVITYSKTLSLTSDTSVQPDKTYYANIDNDYIQVYCVVGDTITSSIVDAGYIITSDETALSGVTYYTYADGVFTTATLDVGTSLTGTTYYTQVTSVSLYETAAASSIIRTRPGLIYCP